MNGSKKKRSSLKMKGASYLSCIYITALFFLVHPFCYQKSKIQNDVMFSFVNSTETYISPFCSNSFWESNPKGGNFLRKWVLQCIAQPQPMHFPFVSLIDSRKPLFLLTLTRGTDSRVCKRNRGWYFLPWTTGAPPTSLLRGKVVEHICLLKAKDDLSEEEESDMLDHLYTTQYQMGGVVAISLGRVSDLNPEHFTHALYMRFQRKESLEKFYENPFYSKVLKERVMTYCHGLMNVDYESEVDDDMFSIFRKGEEFNHGVEFVLLMSFNDSALGNLAENALTSLASLILESPSLIVQFTQGLNFSPSFKEYTHGVVIRFRSVEAFEIFISSKEYKDIWLSKFQPIVQKSLSLHFSVDPVGTEIM